MDDLRCITLRQPYASLVAHQTKRWETRTWPTSYRGPLAIHAGKSAVTLAEADQAWQHFTLDQYQATRGLAGAYELADPLPLGAVVAVTQLTDCLPIVTPQTDRPFTAAVEVTDGSCLRLWREQGRPEDISAQLPYGHWEPGHWAWLLTDIRPLTEPVPAKGRQGLWRPDDDLTARIAAASGTGGTT